jgi:hypothetical protein
LTIFKDEHIQALIARERMKQQAALTKAQTAARLKLEKEKRQIEKKAQQRVREDATR